VALAVDSQEAAPAVAAAAPGNKVKRKTEEIALLFFSIIAEISHL
jgi:hypothetical protein